MEKYYIAYGSNLNYNQMKHRCPNAEIVGTSVLEGWELLFRGSMSGAYLTIARKENGIVPVGIWKVTEQDEKALDRYEGFPRFYYKENFNIKVLDGKEITAFAYIMQENRGFGLPSEIYINTCSEGYDFFGFNKKYLNEAVENSKRRITE